MVILGIILIIMSLLLLLISKWGLAGIAFGILLIVFGRNKGKSPGPVKAPRPQPSAPEPAPAKKDAASKQHEPAPMPVHAASKTETHHVAGTSFRESEIQDLMEENFDYNMTAAELIDAGMEDERVYKYEETYCTASLEPDPDNEYDPNAIKVLANGVHIGYIKKGSTAHIKKLMDDGAIVSMIVTIIGGPYKTAYLNDDDRPRTKKSNYNFSVDLEIQTK